MTCLVCNGLGLIWVSGGSDGSATSVKMAVIGIFLQSTAYFVVLMGGCDDGKVHNCNIIPEGSEIC